MNPTVLFDSTARANDPETHPKGLQPRLRVVFWCVATLFGFLQAWNTRFTMNSDGISYLDLADAYVRSGWKGLVNGHWSPMYPWLIGLAKWIVKPSAYAEFTVVHLLNFACFLAAAGAFEWMLSELIRSRQEEAAVDSEALPAWALQVIGYVVFLSLSLSLISMERLSPDMLMSVFVYVATAIVLKIRSGTGHIGWFVLLGVTLAVGYYAKAPMFPLAFVFLGVAFLARRNFTRAIPGLAVAIAAFILVSMPFVVAISHAAGHLTFGESGRWNYLTVVNEAGPLWYMQDVGSAKGKFLHPPQKLYDFPPVYAFSGPVAGTMPAWYDPAYWTAGPKPHLALHRQFSVIAKNLGACFDLVFGTEAALLALVLVFFVAGNLRASLNATMGLWPVWLPALAAICMYLLVLVQERYIAVFFIVLWMALFASIRLSNSDGSRKLIVGGVCALVLALGAPLALSAVNDLQQGRHRHHAQWDVAQQLRKLGVHSGDLVGRIGGAHRVEWARLLRTRVIAEIPQEQAEYFWSSNASVQEQILEKFRQTGATAIVAQQMEPWAVFVAPQGWQRLGKSDFYVYLLSHTPNEQTAPAAAASPHANH